GSGGDDVDRIRASDLAAVVLETGANLGYAAGNNVGLAHALDAGFEVVGVLNNHTVADPDCFRLLVGASASDLAVAPSIVYADAPERIWFGGGVIDRGWPRHLQEDELGGIVSLLRPSGWL